MNFSIAGKGHVKLLLAIVLTVLLIMPFASCDQQTSLRDAIARAITQTSQVQSYRVIANTTTHTDGITTVSSYELEYAASDRYHVFTTVIVDGGNATTVTSSNGASVTVTTTGSWNEIIVVGDKGYLRSSNESQWRICEFLTSRLTQPTPGTGTCFVSIQTLGNKLKPFNYLVELEVLPDEEIGGIGCSHYRGEVDQDSYVEMLRGSDEEAYEQITPDNLEWMLQREIVVELWIDGADHIRQQRTEYRFPDPNIKEKWVSSFGITRYFDFNEPIGIEPPEIESE
jgi:hypothetical protein